MAVRTTLRSPTWFSRTALFDVLLVGILAVAGVTPLLPDVVRAAPSGAVGVAVLAGVGFAVGQALYVIATGLESLLSFVPGILTARRTFEREVTDGGLLADATVERFGRACESEFGVAVVSDDRDAARADETMTLGDDEVARFFPHIASFVYSHGGGLYSTMQATFSFCRSMTLLCLILLVLYVASPFVLANTPTDPGSGGSVVPLWLAVVLFGTGSLAFYAGYVKFRRRSVEYLVSGFAVHATVRDGDGGRDSGRARATPAERD